MHPIVIGSMDKTSKTTTDHEEIRRWVEERDGTPARVKGTERTGKGPGMIRVDFPGWSGEDSLEPIEWDEWFEVFDDHGLAFVYQEAMADGTPSRFNKIVGQQSAASKAGSHSRTKRGTKRGRAMSRNKRMKNGRSSHNSRGGRKAKEKKMPRRRKS